MLSYHGSFQKLNPITLPIVITFCGPYQYHKMCTVHKYVYVIHDFLSQLHTCTCTVYALNVFRYYM